MGRARLIRVVIAASTIAACFGYVTLSQTEQTSVVFPSSVGFPNTVVGQSSMRSITISPAAGEQNDVVQSIVEQGAGCPAITLTLPPLPAPVTSTCTDGGGTAMGSEVEGSGSGSGCTEFDTTSYTFTATFTPTFSGPQSCVLLVTVSGSTSTITLTGSGTPPPIDIQIETGITAGTTSRCTSCLLDFGQKNVGAVSSPLFVKLVQAGTGTARTNATIAGSAFAISAGDPSDVDLANGQSNTLSITCNPSGDGVLETGTLTIDDPNRTQVVMLKCTGIQSSLDLDTTVAGLSTRVGETTSQLVQLTNTGGAVMTISSVAFTAPDGSAPPEGLATTIAVGNQIAANGGSVTRQISFTPVSPSITTPIAKLAIGFENNTKFREIIVNGPALETTLSLAPTGPGGTANLGTVCVGSTRSEPFTLVASSTGSFLLTEIRVSGDPAFSVVPTSPSTLPSTGNPATLLANGASTVTFDIAVTPGGAGALAGALTLRTDIPGQPNPDPIVVMASALASGASVDPRGPVDLGTVKVGETSEVPTTIAFTNCNATPITITSAAINGDDAFVISTTPDPVVPANGRAEYQVVLTPQSGGIKIAALELEHEGALASVSLIGNGDGPLEEEAGDPRDTYYACSTSGGGSLAGPLLALLLVLRRRRR